MKVWKGRHIIGHALGCVFVHNPGEISLYFELWFFYIYFEHWR